MTTDLTENPISRTILNMAFPMSWGILSIIGFNLADTYFIGNLGKVELAAITLTFPVVMIFFSLALGVGTAASAIISKSIGEKDEKSVKRFTSDSLTYALILVVISVFIGFLSLDPLFILLGATDQTLPLIREYMIIWYSGMIFITIPMAGNGAIRARGDMKTASIIMFVAAITNIILDPILIYGYGPIPPLGMKGAAYATVIARATTFIASIYLLHFKYQMLDFKRPAIRDAIRSWKKLTSIALPAAGTSMLAPLVMAMITAIIARFGQEEIAAFGIVNRIESLALIFISALSSSIGPFVGQNLGAKKKERIVKGINSSFIMSLAWGTIMAFILSTFSYSIIPIFTSDEQVIELGSIFFQIVPLTFGFFGVRLIVGSAFNGLGKPLYATTLAGVSLLLIYLPLAVLGAYIAELKGIFYSQAIGNIFVGILSYLFIKNYLKKDLNNEEI